MNRRGLLAFTLLYVFQATRATRVVTDNNIRIKRLRHLAKLWDEQIEQIGDANVGRRENSPKLQFQIQSGKIRQPLKDGKDPAKDIQKRVHFVKTHWQLLHDAQEAQLATEKARLAKAKILRISQAAERARLVEAKKLRIAAERARLAEAKKLRIAAERARLVEAKKLRMIRIAKEAAIKEARVAKNTRLACVAKARKKRIQHRQHQRRHRRRSTSAKQTKYVKKMKLREHQERKRTKSSKTRLKQRQQRRNQSKETIRMQNVAQQPNIENQKKNNENNGCLIS